MEQFGTMTVGTGFRYQSAVPTQAAASSGFNRANGLLLRGVVVKTYEVDNPQHPMVLDTPVAIYCDVLTYSGPTGVRWRGLTNVLVSQEIGGMQRGSIWKPRATTMNINNLAVDVDSGPQPSTWDGDHVLVGFMDDSLSQPVILRGIPHPSSDAMNELKPIGNRMSLKLLDGDPSFWKHHGSFFGVEDVGDFVVDTTQANTGMLLPGGQEMPPPVDGTGSQLYNLPKDAKYSIVLNDMSPTILPTPGIPIPVCQFELTQTQFQILMLTLNSLQLAGSGPATTLTIGDGAKSVPIAERLQAFYTTLQGKLTAFDNHLHATGTGPSGPPIPVIAADPWDPLINSLHVTIPNNP